ncbi:hypothetical protein PVIIG_06256 [Plasmodium vivax India VII]|uniref:Vir protein n=1 Tax=Plasmodium vivax India VII TaxID=1077284 RepID=A0A0J9UU34_PLAVI|nr:hypothetical protein PVIIG_06256 [Plasmodium vivax India VII]
MNAENDSNERCRYLNFWTNDQIRKKMISNPNVKDSEINSIVRRFHSVSYFVNGDSSENKCRYDYYRAFNMDLWKKWKELYDYIRNKENLSRITVPNNGSCKIYQDYYAHIKSIYQEFKTECCENENANCPDHLNFNEWCTQKNVLIELECTEPTELGEPPAGGAHVIAAEPGTEEEEEEKKTDATIAGEVGGVEPGPRRAQQEVINGVQLVGSASNSHDDMLVYAIGSDSGTSEAKEELPNAVISKSTGTIVGTSLGFVIPLITIYRFTPLGSWINTKIFRKDRLMENMIRNEREILLNNSGNGEMNFDNTRYHIMYNSANNE